ncbi:MAG TPA: M56 family metallopeptidase [Pirellulales bacterium]|nr:M56 family metallopeptidase [Pirellulales bacterium]
MTADLDTLLDLAWRQWWQVTLVAALGAAAMRWACRGRPHLAYLIGLVVLVKCWTPPIWSSHGGLFCWPPKTSLAATTAADSLPERAAKAAPHANTAAISKPMRTQAAVAPPAADPLAIASPPVAESSSLVVPESVPSSRSRKAALLFSLWLLGAVAVFGASCVRWRQWRRALRPLKISDDRRWKNIVEEIAARVGLRRSPRVVVTATPLGPAVFGLWRPAIVVPSRLLTGHDRANMEMVLAHEMVHIRRGDLYVGLFQLATQIVWWFHPFVWWIGRQVSRERERSCDEAVLATLQCPPASYAQCLLDILRLKRQVPILPALPGMRAVDVTEQRLHHIMRSNGAARRRTPLVYWLAAAALLYVILPGQQLTVAMSDDPQPAGPREPQPTPPREPAVEDRAAGAAPDDNKNPPPADAAAKADDPPSAPAQLEQPTIIDQAIDRAVAFLIAEQRADGSWPDPVGYRGGISALCTLALIEAGIKPDAPSVQAALAFLRPIRPSMTYSTALQTVVFCAADPRTDRALIERNVDWLVEQQKRKGEMVGAWGYPQAAGDNSNTAFAVLALHEAERAGVKAGNAAWRRTLDYWINHQNRDGSWGYKPAIYGTTSMTSQGLFCVAAAAKALGEDAPEGAAAQVVEKAAVWLTRTFETGASPTAFGQRQWQYYSLLSLGKAGRISGRDRFGKLDWFAEGSQSLLEWQQPNGCWRGPGHAEDDPHLATSMALLFLAQSRAKAGD